MADAVPPRRRNVEWPTLGLVLACYLLWALSTTWLALLWLPLGIVGVALAAGLHSSLTHEAIHGHPFRSQGLNAALVFPALSLVVPYMRFAETHRAHHHDEIITDPYDDPETHYLDPAVWQRQPGWFRCVLRANNTLLGRMVIGPALGTVTFTLADMRAIRAGDRAILRAWAWHMPALVPVIWWMATVSDMPVWALLLGTYLSHSLLKIRTFLEHQAHLHTAARTVVIEDRGPLALLFLNNNFHSVHHRHPGRPWYDLPGLYRQGRQDYLGQNQGYMYPSYRDVFRRYLCRAKEPVAHPHFPTVGE